MRLSQHVLYDLRRPCRGPKYYYGSSCKLSVMGGRLHATAGTPCRHQARLPAVAGSACHQFAPPARSHAHHALPAAATSGVGHRPSARPSAAEQARCAVLGDAHGRESPLRRSRLGRSRLARRPSSTCPCARSATTRCSHASWHNGRASAPASPMRCRGPHQGSRGGRPARRKSSS